MSPWPGLAGEVNNEEVVCAEGRKANGNGARFEAVPREFERVCGRQVGVR